MSHTTSNTLSYAIKTQLGALCIALITAGAFFAIPIPGSPVPVVLQNLFVVFTGVILTPGWAMLTVGVYLLLGALGLPVLAGAAGGLSHFAGPTGGFLVGFVLAAGLTSVLIRFGRDASHTPAETGWVRRTAAVTAGFLVIYVPGVPRLAAVTGLSLAEVLWIGFIPFLPGDVVKAVVLLILLKSLPNSLWRSWS